MKQETVCAIPTELFAVSDGGASSSKGACVCAVVVLPSRPPKYTLVCYNAQQVTFCVARMSWVDGRNTSLRLVVAPSGHVSFTDDTSQRWTLFFNDAAQLTRFLACVGVALYSLYGAPATSVFYHDLSLPSSSSPRLEAADRASVRFVGFELAERDGVCSVGPQLQQQQSGKEDTPPYVFRPRTGSVQLDQGCFGFEGSVLGMREEDRRVLVVPAGYTTSISESLTNVAEKGAVYVVQLLRVEHVQPSVEKAAAGDATGQAAAAAPPAVYAATAEAEPASNTRALALVGGTTSAVLPAPQPSAAAARVSSEVPAFFSASGIPPEHMSVLRKVEVGVNAAVTAARDVHDVAGIFAQEWRHHVVRPKPSLLSNKALLEQVQRVVSEEETAQADLDKCDRLVQALDARNRELQQRIDRATVESQKLLEEKNNASAKAMDARLEKDRQLVRLKDTLLVRRQEQDDLQRHVAALQRTVDVAAEELRQVQGRRDIHHVEATSMAERLAAMQATLSEERHRNAALVAKTAATEESLKKAQAQQRVAEGQLTTARGLAEKERLRYVQIMEEERHHRAQDSELLRHDILHELDARERQYKVDRQRIAEEQFSRGLRDGKAEGRQAAETDLLGHQDELRLNLQRAKTEVETTKEEVRRSIESAMSLRRTLGGKVAELEEQLVTATRRQTELQFRVAQWQTRSRTVRDTVGQHWRTLISYATHPCTRQELLAMMKEVRMAEEKSCGDDVDGEDALVRVDLLFQTELWKQSRTASVERRLGWIAEDMAEMYVKGADYHFEHEWHQPVTAAHDATLEAVANLYAQQHGSRALFDLGVREAQERHALHHQWWLTIHGIETWLGEQRTAQNVVKAAEAEGRQALWKAYVAGGDAVVQLCAAQLRAQVLLIQDEMAGRDGVAAAEAAQRRRLPADAQQMWAADCAAALHFIEEEEEASRAGVEAEAYTASSGIRFQLAYAQRGVEEAEAQRRQQQQVCSEESERRQQVWAEAAREWSGILSAAAAAFVPPLPTLTAFEEEAPRAPSTPPVPAAAPSQVPAYPPRLADETAAAATTAPQRTLEAAAQHADPAFSPPHSPAVPAFTLTDPPRVRRSDPPRPAPDAQFTTAQESNGITNVDLVFSDEPPPLPPSDEDEAPAADNSSSSGAHAKENGYTAVSAPPPPSHQQAEAAPASYADRDAPPPLPSDRDDEPSTSSSASSSSATQTPASRPSPTRTAAPPPPKAVIANIEVDDDEEPPATAKPTKHLFGGSSSEEDDTESDNEERDARRQSGSGSRSSPAAAKPGGAGAKAKSLSASSPAGVGGPAKPKLFASSDDDE